MTFLAFDIDGTIYDCSKIIVQAFEEGISDFRIKTSININIPTKEEIILQLGQPNDLIFQSLFPELKGPELQAINDSCIKSLTGYVSAGGGILFDGVVSTIELLFNEGYQLLVASNGRRDYIEAVLNSNDLIKFISKPVICINNEISNKNDIVRHYIRHRCSGNPAIMIGDRESDKIAAEVNGIPFIGCSFGHTGSNEIRGSRWIVSDFSSIYRTVKEVEKILFQINV